MNIDQVTLLKYIDNQLSPADAEHIRLAALQDPELQRQIEFLRASELPFDTAFEQELLPQSPADLRRYLSNLDTEVVDFEANDGHSLLRRVAVLFLAFMLGWFASSYIPQIQSGADQVWSITQGKLSSSDQQLASYGGKELVDSMMIYQRLYAQETIANAVSSPDSEQRVIDQFNRDSGRTLKQFEAPGLTFKRMQNLRLDDKAIAQMVYSIDGEKSPSELVGHPIAICATRVDAASLADVTYSLKDMNAVIWVDDGIAYALMGKQPLSDLRDFRSRLKVKIQNS